MDRAQHLAWAKARALEYVERGDLTNAIASLVSDLGKHEALRDADMRESVAISAAANGNGAADGPNAVALARRHPIGNVIVTALMIATWPLVLTWVKVRENWR